VDIEDVGVVERVGFPLTTGVQRLYYIMLAVRCADEFAIQKAAKGNWR
jgi:hypothetical protein